MKVRLPDDPKTVERAIRKLNLQEFEKQSKQFDALILYTLHEEFGFGAIRLKRFAKKMCKIHDYFRDRYDDASLFAMQKKLLALGIDIDNLDKEIQEEMRKDK
jgi:hypothetical protein